MAIITNRRRAASNVAWVPLAEQPADVTQWWCGKKQNSSLSVKTFASAGNGGHINGTLWTCVPKTLQRMQLQRGGTCCVESHNMRILWVSQWFQHLWSTTLNVVLTSPKLYTLCITYYRDTCRSHTKSLEISCKPQPLIGHAVKCIMKSFKGSELRGLVTAYEDMVLRWHGFWRDGGETSHIRKASTTREARNT